MRITYLDTAGNRQTYEMRPLTAQDRLSALDLEMCGPNASPDAVAEANGIREALADELSFDRKAALRLVKRALVALDVLNDISHTKYLRDLLDIVKAEEKRGQQAGDKLTLAERTQLFTVWRLAEYATALTPLPDLRDYLWTRRSLYQAAAIAILYGPKIRQALFHASVDIHILARLDFAKLNK